MMLMMTMTMEKHQNAEKEAMNIKGKIASGVA